ncbi:MAG TPA: Xaa-Pro peptidase family protein [Thermoplasmata archaeon]
MKQRVKAIYRHLDGAADVIVFSNSTDPHIDMSFFYATGLTDGLFEGCTAWLFPEGRCEIVVSALEEEAAKKSGIPLHLYRNRDERLAAMKQLLRRVRRIGINGSEITHRAFLELKKLAPKARFTDVAEAVMKARLVKDDSELERIRRACDIASRSFQQVLGFIEPGRVEGEIAGELVYTMQRNGASGASFRTIVGSGPNSAEPHYTAGPRKLERGDLVVIDFGALYEMYHSDITRTVVVGEATSEHREMYDTVRRAQDAAMERMRAGARGKSVDAAARKLIDSTKYKGRFIHGVGHSLGLAVHDGAGLNATSNVVLRPGMVFTNEPGVYVPGFGGVRVEDDILITRSDPEILSSAPNEFLVVG